MINFYIIVFCCFGFLYTEYKRYKQKNSEVVNITYSDKRIYFECKYFIAYLNADKNILPKEIKNIKFIISLDENNKQNYVSFDSHHVYKLTYYKRKLKI